MTINFFHANSTSKFFPRTCCDKYIKHDTLEPGFYKEFRLLKCYVYVAKRIVAIIQ